MRWLRFVGGLALIAAVASGVSLGGPSAATTPPVTADTVAHAPTRIAQTTQGPVGYRSFGSGSPLVLVMGLSGSMDDWPPGFLADLARQHRVVVFDNAGVGQSAALGTPLTVTAMAGQTSALISTLRLGRTAVLGWSLGGMVAQALAVLHPAQVSRLVLAATQSGDGRADPIPGVAAEAAASADPARVLSVLFPSAAAAASAAYVKGILGYPGFYQAPVTVTARQGVAIDQWMAGHDAAGVHFDQVRAPVLVADGTQDALDPSANDRVLAHSVRGGHLVLFPGAGHAFLFQDASRFLPEVEHFLG